MTGRITLVGAGEMMSAMSSLHRAALQKLGEPARPVFLDTTAGYETNVDAIAEKAVEYYAHHFPINPGTYGQILRESDLPQLSLFADAFSARAKDLEEARGAQRQLADAAKDPAVAAAIDKAVAAFDGSQPANQERLHALLESQHYRLASWRTAGSVRSMST